MACEGRRNVCVAPFARRDLDGLERPETPMGGIIDATRALMLAKYILWNLYVGKKWPMKSMEAAASAHARYPARGAALTSLRPNQPATSCFLPPLKRMR